MQLQVIADSRMVLLDAFTGYPGSVHDACVLRSSPVYQSLMQNPPPPQFHLLGDSAYPLTRTLLTPYRDNGHLSSLQKKYNKVHSSTRVDVERAIGLLKGKWRRLKYLDMLDTHRIPQVIMAACVLHNFVLQAEKAAAEDEAVMEDEMGMGMAMEPEEEDVGDGEAKRRDIANLLL